MIDRNQPALVVKSRRGGRRPGAGRPRIRPIPDTVRAAVLAETSPQVLEALERIQRSLAAQDVRLDRLAQQRRNDAEYPQQVLKRLTALERLIRGGDLHIPPKHTRHQPMGR